MCGIVGYLGPKDPIPIVIEMLKRVEYRGYDSAGVAWLSDGEIKIVKTVGPVANLHSMMLENTVSSRGSKGFINRSAPNCAIAHTRWATHGTVTVENAHPHLDCTEKVAIVHNGIIENYSELKRKLRGHIFRSETDSEVIAHLVEDALQENKPTSAVRLVTQLLRGSFSFLVLVPIPPYIVGHRAECPLIVGLADDETYFASDSLALSGLAEECIVVPNGVTFAAA